MRTGFHKVCSPLLPLSRFPTKVAYLDVRQYGLSLECLSPPDKGVADGFIMTAKSSQRKSF